MAVGPTIFTGDNSMRKEPFEKKLDRVEERMKAYEDAYRLLYDLQQEEGKSEDYRDALEGILRVITNMQVMCRAKRETIMWKHGRVP